MATEQRKLLEQLMGADALDPKAGLRKQEINLYDPRICKSFLVDFCVHDLFTNTKQDLGPCPRLHLEKHKMEYVAQKNRGKEFPEFNLEHEKELERYVMECNRRIDAANKRLEKTPEDIAKMNEITAAIDEICSAINLSLEEIELLGEQGEVSRALYENSKLAPLRQQKEAKEKEMRMLSEVSGFSGHQKLQVCEECGAYLSRIDNDRRLADHFIGKMHKGYVQIRQAYAEMKEKNASIRKRPRY
ncbi:protein Luc7p [Trichomonascus vanleenenianus]|uniref:Luc7p n=1 Tax=Trichomonascus vanleenenianus TaxID=2268995 RepID=UPI003ECB0539